MNKENSICEFCGKSVPSDELDEFNACLDCHQEPELHHCEDCGKEISEPGRCEDCEYDHSLCPHCDGTGEGQYDGTSCRSCKGSGVRRSHKEYEYGGDDDEGYRYNREEF